ncbi:MAG TPA: hypothetical protein VFP61_04760 [Acidimicrobiales bacterium]|nr:hypothetical protein [Acidimicrobiales bacterium]
MTERVITEPSLGVSVRLPPGWDWQRSDVFPLQLLGPAGGSYRPSISFSDEPLDPPTGDGLRDWVGNVVTGRAAAAEGFELLEQDVVPFAGRHAYLVRYRRWFPPIEATIEQLLALVAVEPGRLLEVDASVLADRPDAMRPVLDVLDSVALTG